jgi:uncharacterized membrane protein
MKFLFLAALFIVLFLSSCSKKEEEKKLSAYNAEAFAYDLGNSWEVNSTTRVKGFDQQENNGMFKASLAYDINLITPKNDTVKSLISKVIDKSEKEKMTDTDLETQFDLDSTYSDGKYTLIFNIKDVTSGRTASVSAGFKLSRE